MRMYVPIEIENIYLVRVGGVEQMRNAGITLDCNASDDCDTINDIMSDIDEEWCYDWPVTIYHGLLPQAQQSAQIINDALHDVYVKIEARKELNRNAHGVGSIVDLIHSKEHPWPAIIVAHEQDLCDYLYGIGSQREWDPGRYRDYINI